MSALFHTVTMCDELNIADRCCWQVEYAGVYYVKGTRSIISNIQVSACESVIPRTTENVPYNYLNSLQPDWRDWSTMAGA